MTKGLNLITLLTTLLLVVSLIVSAGCATRQTGPTPYYPPGHMMGPGGMMGPWGRGPGSMMGPGGPY